jgi:hypothetical protein
MAETGINRHQLHQLDAAPIRFENRIQFAGGSMIAIMHGCIESRAAH